MLLLLGALALVLSLLLLLVRRARGDADAVESPRASSRPTRGERLVAETFEHACAARGARNVLVLYATEYGFAREVARAAARALAALPVARVRVLSAADYACADFAREAAVMLVASTTGDGVPPGDAAGLRAALGDGAVRLTGAAWGALALGDRAYPHFCRGGTVLAEGLAGAGGRKVVETGLVDQEDWEEIHAWVAAFKDAVEKDGVAEKEEEEGEEGAVSGTEEEEEEEDYLRAAVAKYAAGLSDDSGVRYSRADPYTARVSRRRVLTRGGGKTVVRVDLDISGSGLRHAPGDALGVLAENNAAAVDALLGALAATGDEPVQLAPPGSDPVPLRDALLRRCDLRAVRAELFALLRASTRDGAERARAGALLDGGRLSEAGKVYAEERHVVDVLGDFAGAAPRAADVARALRPLAPRYYSVSGGDAAEVGVTVDVMRYVRLGAAREGVGSTYLGERAMVGDAVRVFVARNDAFRLPRDAGTDVVMVGPGTGVAPFLAFLEARAAGDGRNVLFFGCRREKEDFLYEEELRGYEADGRLELHTAFSRDGPQKVYVQHRMRERGAEVWGMVRGGACVYVCGDARRMAADVRAELVRIAGEFGDGEGEESVRRLEDEGRLMMDVWAS